MAMKVGELDSITTTRPDDWHLHLRDGAALMDVVEHSARQFVRAIIMPNLKPPVTTVALAREYCSRILQAAKYRGFKDFQPLMTLYLTDNTLMSEIDRAKESGIVHAVKYYPAGATTNSDSGVTDIKKVYPQLARMEDVDLPLLVHGEVTDPAVDVFDREAVFIDRVLTPVMHDFPALRIVFEHVSTREAVQFVGKSKHRIGATIAAHHLLENRNAIFEGGLRSHYFCLPVLKEEKHRQALLMAATSGSPKFFLGTDSAPHARGNKETACAFGGCYTAPAALQLYAEAFDSVGALDKFEGFASHFGADFYGLLRNTGTVTLVREEGKVPDELPFGDDVVVPFRAGKMTRWKMK